MVQLRRFSRAGRVLLEHATVGVDGRLTAEYPSVRSRSHFAVRSLRETVLD
ncbi:hypothetical protein [Verrucosispora sp. WMMC514]|uniref:hypothetical protein n=1 Tax=Verrucosispora sp. WMMC514 TaxID=3015156 RepID=UPI00248AB157|nr:hypothetical protein [Verrucosispora sp. WMMC514]WBB89944.1 hypothetical protein O7597_23605 [Verrucosispora sp. WMMC514]